MGWLYLKRLDPNGFVVKSDLYQLYKKYVEVVNQTESEDLTLIAQKDFTRNITKLFLVRTGKSRVRTPRSRCT